MNKNSEPHLTTKMVNKTNSYVKYNVNYNYVFKGYVAFVLLAWVSVCILLVTGWLIGLAT